jgi:acyl-CoA thioesterase I
MFDLMFYLRFYLKSFSTIVATLGFVALGTCALLNSSALANVDTSQQKTIVFVGDSLTEGYGVKKQEAYPELLAKILNERKKPVKIINGSISGSVTADADRRVKWFLKAKPDLLVLALGSNDALKGTPPEVIKKNLSQAIDLALANKIKVLLCGVQVFTNFGEEYNRSLAKVYRQLADEKKIAFLPFLLEGVAIDKNLNQEDGKHPNAKGHEVIARHMANVLEKLL